MYFFCVEQLSCSSSEKDRNQGVDFEISGASDAKVFGGEFNIGAVQFCYPNL